nr:immunoglobulin light chain junction region [Macaca mulatta]MOV94224.1 immunoglobulin light chain junction region [Macaca mulatta]MOV94642.1 immunoglobulin light chain junction region [Macaca mulatta]MOV94804.1 immunoglobulin light chain junction region [Macaca mulatta]MOV95026.1 immunoglobulin light chain junction region [Macaca mulatta]
NYYCATWDNSLNSVLF